MRALNIFGDVSLVVLGLYIGRALVGAPMSTTLLWRRGPRWRLESLSSASD
jgi:hypothetical protein